MEPEGLSTSRPRGAATGGEARTLVLAPVLLSEADQSAIRGLPLRAQHAMATALIMALFMVGLGLAFDDCMPAEGLALFMGAGVATACALQMLQGAGASKFALRLAGVASMALMAAAVVALPACQAGLYEFGNQIITRYNDAFGAYAPLFPTTSNASGQPFYVLTGALCAFTIWLLLSNRLVIALSAATFLLCATSCWLGTSTGLTGAMLSLTAWFASWRLILNNRFLSLRSAIIALGFGACIAALALAFGLLYQPSAGIANLRDGIVSAIDAARYGSDTLPEGDLAKAAGMNQGADERLQVTWHGALMNDLHLNGFVGATFDGVAWQPLTHRAYEGTWTGMFDWLDARGFDPHLQRALYDAENAAQGQGATDATTVDVQVTGANRAYAYAPAGLRGLSGAQAEQGRDGSLLTRGLIGPSTYALQVDQVDADADVASTPAWLAAVDDVTSADAYLGSEAVYRSFAYEQYLDLSDEDRALIEKLFYDPFTWTNEDPTTAAVISRVRAMLTTLASYTDAPASWDGSGGFLSWFLEQQRQGNSAHFSTAAVMAFRAQGIPARYVEGYYAEASPGAADGDQTLLQLTSADAHAWVEVYLDGIGWSPVEVTPGFYTQPYRADQVIAVNQDVANNNSSDSEPAGALGGDTNNGDDADDDADDNTPLAARVVMQAAAALLALAVLAMLMLAALESRRAHLRTRASRACASDDQAVSVPALFDELTRMMMAAGAAFDAARPLSSTDGFASAFSAMTSEEYQRVVNLMQKRAFGRKELRPHEMRALRSFNGRVGASLEPPRGLRDRFLWRYKYLR